jgi:hypothetical protein
LKLIQDQVSKDIFIATWDQEQAELEKIIKKPKDLPECAAKYRKHFANYFSGYLNPRKGKESKFYLKVRFITSHPNKLDISLDDLGQELSESITEEIPEIFMSRNPYACQAVKSECIGWFFGSTKSTDSTKMVTAIKEKLKIDPCLRRNQDTVANNKR